MSWERPKHRYHSNDNEHGFLYKCPKEFKWDTMVENFTIFQMDPPAVGEVVEVFSKILHIAKKTCTVEIEMYNGSELQVKALTTLKVVKK